MLVTTTTTKSALGAVVTRVPSLSDFDVDPVTVIRTGDLVTVDADAGTVTIHAEAKAPDGIGVRRTA
jgi:phosphohistidine swiveling domain-containing protein